MTDAEWRIEDIRLRNEYAAQYARDLEQRARHEVAVQARHGADQALRREIEAAQLARHNEDQALRKLQETAYQLRHDAAMAWAQEKEAAEKARHEQSQAALTRQFDLLINPPASPPSLQQLTLDDIAKNHKLLAEAVWQHLQKTAP